MSNYSIDKMGNWDEKSFLEWRTSLARKEIYQNKKEEYLMNEKIKIDREIKRLKRIRSCVSTCPTCQKISRNIK